MSLAAYFFLQQQGNFNFHHPKQNILEFYPCKVDKKDKVDKVNMVDNVDKVDKVDRVSKVDKVDKVDMIILNSDPCS